MLGAAGFKLNNIIQYIEIIIGLVLDFFKALSGN
jgi:hypothetical protein